MNKEYIVSGKGMLSYKNICSACEHAKDSELEQLESRVHYLMEKSQEDLEKMELGMELIGVDFVDLETKLEALKSVQANKKQIKKVLGANEERIKDLSNKRSELAYRQSMLEKIREARG